jgi:hypothetical protein
LDDGSVSSVNDDLEARLAAIPDDVSLEAAAPGELGGPPAPILPPSMNPWETADVKWLVPLAGKLIQLPYEQVAKRTHDDCWLVTDDQIAILNPALENALKWVTWRLGIANQISHPLVQFGVAIASLTAVKYGMYQFNQHQRSAGGPGRPGNPRQGPLHGQQPSTPSATLTTSGKMAESVGESSSAASPGAANHGSSRKEFVIADE